jgi:hypothetical protein
VGCALGVWQVYKAVLRDTGEEVAVKVQRPGVEPVIMRDLFIFRSMARFINPISKARATDNTPSTCHAQAFPGHCRVASLMRRMFPCSNLLH